LASNQSGSMPELRNLTPAELQVGDELPAPATTWMQATLCPGVSAGSGAQNVACAR
jgi:hypothetical protein